MSKKYDYEKKGGEVSQETIYYAQQLQEAVKQFAEQENLEITAVETTAVEGEALNKPVTTFEVTLISSELTAAELDKAMKRTIQ